MLRLSIATLLLAAALCTFFSSPRREFQPVTFLPVQTAAVAPLALGPATVYPVPADPRAVGPLMAVPKKRTSKMKTRSRKANWFAKADKQAELAWNRAKSLKANPEDFMNLKSDDEDDEDEEDEE